MPDLEHVPYHNQARENPEPHANVPQQAAPAQPREPTQDHVFQYGKVALSTLDTREVIDRLSTDRFSEGKHAGKTFIETFREDPHYHTFLGKVGKDPGFRLYCAWCSLRSSV